MIRSTNMYRYMHFGKGFHSRNRIGPRIAGLRRLSTTDHEAVDPAQLSKAPAAKVKPKPLFPWRHERDLLPRLTPGTREYENDLVLPDNGLNTAALIFLNLSFLDAYVTQNWKQELADHSAYAFSRAISGICSNTYHIPFEDISFDEKTNFHFDPSKVAKDEDETKFCPTLKYMVDQDLRKMYESAHKSGKDQLQIRLQMEPTEAHFVNLFALPFVTREAVSKDPSILDAMRENIHEIRSSPGGAYGKFMEYIDEQAEKNNEKLYTTVDVQVLVECEEIFTVTDYETGVVLQGSEDGSRRNVRHLVRLETTVETTHTDHFPYFPRHRPGEWIITDIDDLLGEEKWYNALRLKQ